MAAGGLGQSGGVPGGAVHRRPRWLGTAVVAARGAASCAVRSSDQRLEAEMEPGKWAPGRSAASRRRPRERAGLTGRRRRRAAMLARGTGGAMLGRPR